MLVYLTTGIVLGLSAGFAPGPLLTLVLSETLQHGRSAGFRVALAPLITDLPIIVLTMGILAALADTNTILGVISLIGGGVIGMMGLDSLRFRGTRPDPDARPSRSLLKGILANALNPHPYLFWLTVGAPLVTRALNHSLPAAAAFFAGFYTLLVGSKLLLAVVAARSTSFLSGKIYITILRILGGALILLAGMLIYDGLELLGMLAH